MEQCTPLPSFQPFMKSIPIIAFSFLVSVSGFAADAAQNSSSTPKVVSNAVLRAKPDVKFRADPIYPEELGKRGVAGTATIQFVITPTGEPKDLKVVEASHPAFGIAARDAVQRSRFKPAVGMNGEPVAVTLQVPFTFVPPGKKS